MKMRSYVMGLLALMMIAVSCKKTDFDFTPTGEALTDFRLTSPMSNTVLALNAATPTAPLEITWTATKAGVIAPVKYTWVAALKNGNLDAPVVQIPSDNNGTATKLSLTHKSVDDALKAAGIAEGATTELIWSVVADNGTGNTKLRSTDTYNLTVKRMGDGATPFVLLGPASTTTSITINPGSTSTGFTFNWTKSIPAKTATGVKYRVYFYKDDGSMTPLFSVASNNTGNDSVLNISHKAFSDSLSAHGFNNPAVVAGLKWRVAATSGDWVQWSDFSNQFYVLREVKLFIVGGSSPADWNPSAAIQMIPDDRFPGTFFAYVRLTTAGGGIKLLSENTDWSSPTITIYGDVSNSGVTGDLTSAGGGNNINVPADGIYRVTADLTNNKYYLQTGGIGALGLVGAFQGWNPSSNIRMANFAPNRSIVITNMTNNDEFKMHDGDQWDNGANNKSRWYGIDNGALKIDGGSLPGLRWLGATGPVRAIFDGSNVNNLSYDLSAASEMRVVGNGINQAGVNDWDPGSSPQMTYTGNGVWTITVTLKADMEIKFVAGNAWGAFDYEDAGTGPTTLGAPRKMQYGGGPNFRTPATAGTYTITLNEYTQTVTIN